MNAASRGAGTFVFRALSLSAAFGAALAVSACVGPDMSEIGDYGAGLSPFASSPIAAEAASGADLHRLDPQGRERRGGARAVGRGPFRSRHHDDPARPSRGLDRGAALGQAERQQRHRRLAGERELDGDEFRAELASHVSGRIGVNRDILVFVHGFNTSFDEARSRAAQIVADTHFGGVAVLFTWPSRSELFGYVSDKDSATASRDALQALLHDLGQTPGVGKIQISPIRWAAG